MGVTDVWLPPAYKGASGTQSVGYDTYDLFDLGEFDQKGTVPTKYGTRAALEAACAALREHGLRVIHDVVFDHKMGADETERVQVRRTNPDNRTEIEDEAFDATTYTLHLPRPRRRAFPLRVGPQVLQRRGPHRRPRRRWRVPPGQPVWRRRMERGGGRGTRQFRFPDGRRCRIPQPRGL
jgi:hypothetical protein